VSLHHHYTTGSVPRKLEKSLRKHLTNKKNRVKLSRKLESLPKNASFQAIEKSPYINREGVIYILVVDQDIYERVGIIPIVW